MNNIKLINFTQLSQHEKKMVLEWRNSQEIREWMFTPKKISLSNHLNFIESLKSQTDRLYFVVKESENYLGVISFNEITAQSCSLGIYKNPLLFSVGETLIKSICKYGFKILSVKAIYAQVFADNTKAISLYNEHNFTLNSREQYNSKELLNMELKYENWQV